MRFYFHVRTQDCLVIDDEGTDLPDIAAARGEARESAKDFIMDDLRGGEPVFGRLIEITNGAGVLIEAMPIVGALSYSRGSSGIRK